VATASGLHALGIIVRVDRSAPTTYLPPHPNAATKRSRTIVRQHSMMKINAAAAASRSVVPLPLHLQNGSSNVVHMQ
jgi:hypothetical protein